MLKLMHEYFGWMLTSWYGACSADRLPSGEPLLLRSGRGPHAHAQVDPGQFPIGAREVSSSFARGCLGGLRADSPLPAGPEGPASWDTTNWSGAKEKAIPTSAMNSPRLCKDHQSVQPVVVLIGASVPLLTPPLFPGTMLSPDERLQTLRRHP
jgi:hypothetical protein